MAADSVNKEVNLSDVRILISNNITRFMRENNKTRRQMSSDLNVKYTTLCDWINGHSTPKPEAMAAMCDYFGVGIAEFYKTSNPLPDTFSRLSKYAEQGETIMELNLDVIKDMPDEQILALLKKGFRFRHRTLEEYIRMSGKPLIASDESDFGKPMGDELW